MRYHGGSPLGCQTHGSACRAIHLRCRVTRSGSLLDRIRRLVIQSESFLIQSERFLIQSRKLLILSKNDPDRSPGPPTERRECGGGGDVLCDQAAWDRAEVWAWDSDSMACLSFAASCSRSRVSHSQTTRTFQPRSTKSRRFRRSRSILPSSFLFQNSVRVVGLAAFLHPEC